MGDSDDRTLDDGQPEGGRVRNIVELARIAGVSAGTVSRALAGNPLVNIQTREKIEAIARAHDFRPNQMASRLRTKRTGLIGVVIPLGHERRQHLSDPFFMTMLGQLADLITESGHDILLSRVIPESPDWLTRIVESGMLDGVLMIGQSNQFDAIEQTAARYRPLVAWGHQCPGQLHCSVGTDNVAGGRLAAAHLVGRGARRLAFLGDVRTPEIAARHAGFVAEARAAGFDVALLPTHLAADDMEADITHHTGLTEGQFDGVFAASDMIAMRTLRALADRAIAVPERVAIIGFDDLPLTSHTVPRLTSVRQDIAQGAATMVDLLFRRIAGEETASVVMHPSLIVRDSA
ncbi:MAG: LacI family DNA-binding transcriptional regulator [Sphingomonas sp.]|uniref:LacI family DNA-binding transcriptional regulator n=1 Tax=Sphingomonas sp. TaxID=28214 RepID=UPI0025D7D739|nr:LacI family DNA-binding transcriptional regulator [Sphingomonas sp.]MBY0284520.1 LacI family DNA-binding transcriptional regulator [Sphingomonas sp.]